ncbi:hypothetical protein EDD86DRAFT_213146 [Gorgonomyces haynaldii]|nr:hypothetical protein EDD86DRAFT_213146 [Gorgonomyces haynaldii]
MLFLIASSVAADACRKITVRYEVNDMTPKQWQVYTTTIQTAMKTPYKGGLSLWEYYAEMHGELYGSIHSNCLFLPWHRAFLLDLEQQLQKINPNFFFPYWREDMDHANTGASPVWKYLGHSGKPVQDGLAANMPLQVGGSKYLIRSFDSNQLGLPASEMFGGFYRDAKNGYADWWGPVNLYHGILHDKVGGHNIGQMAGAYSPVDPLFYVHHAFYDYMWSEAQTNWQVAGRGVNAQLDNVNGCDKSCKLPAYSITFGEVLDINKQLCYRYAPRGEKPPAEATSTSVVVTSTKVPTTTSTTAKPTTTSVPVTTIKTTSTEIKTTSTEVKTTSTAAKTTTEVKSTSVAPTTSTEVKTTSVAKTTTAASTSVAPTASTEIKSSTEVRSSSVATTEVRSTAVATTEARSTTEEKYTSVATSAPGTGYSLPTELPTATESATETQAETTAETYPTNDVPAETTALPAATPCTVPEDYKPMEKCPEKLSDSWLKLGGKYDEMKQMMEKALAKCEDELPAIKAGNGTYMPTYSSGERPLIAGAESSPVAPQNTYGEAILSGAQQAPIALAVVAVFSVILL